MLGCATMGVVCMERAKQLAVSAATVRAQGGITEAFRQAVHGRTRDGGQRYGFMEGDILNVYGASGVMRDLFYETADKYKVAVCAGCGMVTHGDRCRLCDHPHVYHILMPFASYVGLMQFIMLGNSVRFRFKGLASDAVLDTHYIELDAETLRALDATRRQVAADRAIPESVSPDAVASDVPWYAGRPVRRSSC